MGLKDTILKFGITKRDLSQFYNRGSSYDFVTIPYEDARSLVLGAIEFANALDINPHSSWNGIPSSFLEAHLAYEKKFSFGYKGKPHYISGPYDDDLYNVEEILNKVSKANGHYTIHVPGD